MKRDVAKYCEMGVDGIVSGVLMSDFTLDVERTRELIELSKPSKFTFHRAFDWVPNPVETLVQLEKLGVDYVLTSGKEDSAEKGLTLLNELNTISRRTTIMAGGGVNAQNVEKFKIAGFKAVHLSGTSFGDEISVTDKIPMNSTRHLRENTVAVTNMETIRQIVRSVK